MDTFTDPLLKKVTVIGAGFGLPFEPIATPSESPIGANLVPIKMTAKLVFLKRKDSLGNPCAFVMLEGFVHGQ